MVMKVGQRGPGHLVRSLLGSFAAPVTAMKSVILQSIPAPQNGNTRFFPFVGGTTAAVQASSSSCPSPISVAGTISDGFGKMPNVMTTGSWTVTLMRSTGPTVAFADTSLVGTTTIGSNVITFTGSAAVLAGDLLCWKVAPTGTPDAQGSMQVSTVFTADNAVKGGIFLGASANNTTRYLSPGMYNPVRADAESRMPMPTSGVIDRMDVRLTAAPGTGADRTITVLKNGSPTGLTVNIAGTVTTASITGAGVAFAAGDLINVVDTCSTGVVPVTSIVHVGLDWTPDIAGEGLTFATWSQGQSTTATTFGFVMGQVGSGSGTSATFPEYAPVACTASKLAAITDITPGGGKSRTVTFVKNDVAQAGLSVLADTTVAIGGTPVSVAFGDAITLQNVPAGTPAANNNLRCGMVLAVAA